MEGCSKTEKRKSQKVGCLRALFGSGAAISPRDFKSPVSTDSTTTAASLILAQTRKAVKYYSWSRFREKAPRQCSVNQFSSGRFMACMASQVWRAAESNSVLPAFCSSKHLMWALSLSAALTMGRSAGSSSSTSLS